MSTKFSRYVCQNCGFETSQFFGRCTNCKEWNSIIEEKKSPLSKKYPHEDKRSKSFEEITLHKILRIKTGFDEFDRVLGGGFVQGSIVLLGGEPGIGKSTLVLQAAAKMSNNESVLYITAEESLEQVKIRWERINHKSENLKVFADNNLSVVIEEMRKINPAIAIIDSIHAIHNNEMESTSGSVSQVRSCSAELHKFAKSNNISLLIIGHVTKDGTLAGPKTLEHLVDVVLNFEGDHVASNRILRGIKNRFGATLELGIFDMTEEGLAQINNPSSSFTDQENIAGVATTITIEGTRSFVVDIQALVIKSFYNNPKRSTTGINSNRVHQILAVIEKHLKIRLSEYDCYIATAGGFDINDPTSDLCIAVSIISSLKNINPLPNCIYCGELGLNGQLRKTKNLKLKIEEATRLGYKKIMVPKITTDLIGNSNTLIELIEVESIKEAMYIALN
tara:strand:- start:622 stop:1968 length:1347 start_codon:yes stop_codon:yes gene_type:complete